MNWESGESTYEALNNIAADDPVTCAIYGMKNNLLEEEGWRHFKKIAKRHKKLKRLLNQGKLQPYHTQKVYKFGILVPCHHREAIELSPRKGHLNRRKQM